MGKIRKNWEKLSGGLSPSEPSLLCHCLLSEARQNKQRPRILMRTRENKHTEQKVRGQHKNILWLALPMFSFEPKRSLFPNFHIQSEPK